MLSIAFLCDYKLNQVAFVLHTWKSTFVAIILNNQDLLHTLHFADFCHDLRRPKTP